MEIVQLFRNLHNFLFFLSRHRLLVSQNLHYIIPGQAAFIKFWLVLIGYDPIRCIKVVLYL
jgi:hypothetical protein